VASALIKVPARAKRDEVIEIRDALSFRGMPGAP
jgi:hypothetical protein